MRKRTRAIPEKIKQLFNLVNALPSEPKRFPYTVDRYKLEDISTEFMATVTELPESLREFIGQIDLKTSSTLLQIEPRRSKGYRPDQTMRAGYNKYIMLVSAKSALLEIAAFNDWKYDHEYPEKVTFTRSIPVEVTVIVTLRASDKGHFSLTNNLGLEAFLDDDMEVERIKQCPICGNIYWAGRITKPACSKECDNTLRQRRYREKLEEQIAIYEYARIKAQEKRELKSKVKSKIRAKLPSGNR